MKNKIKQFLNKFGLYKTTQKIISKIYYPYKNYKIKKEASGILSILKKTFDKNCEDYWLDYGTLLGFVRDGKIIGHDIDMDFGIKINNGVVLAKQLGNYGFKLTQQTIVDGKITTEMYLYKGVGFDIFYYFDEDNKVVTYPWLTSDHSVPQKIAYEQNRGELSRTVFTKFATKEIEFYGIKFRVPEDSDRYLKEHFGDDYMIPNPNWGFEDEKNRKPINRDYKVIFYE